MLTHTQWWVQGLPLGGGFLTDSGLWFSLFSTDSTSRQVNAAQQWVCTPHLDTSESSYGPWTHPVFVSATECSLYIHRAEKMMLISSRAWVSVAVGCVNNTVINNLIKCRNDCLPVGTSHSKYLHNWHQGYGVGKINFHCNGDCSEVSETKRQWRDKETSLETLTFVAVAC